MNACTDKEKSGVFTGSYTINPINNQKIPIYVASFVIADYGTGIVMGVPAHDERDFEFAQQFNLPVQEVIASPDIKRDSNGIINAAYTGDGTLINSNQFDGMQAQSTGKNAIVDFLVNEGLCRRTKQIINYAIGYFPVNAIGVNQFHLFIAKHVALFQFQKINFR